VIKKIKIEGYKCFDNALFSCSELTLLAGDNLSGKTAVIESLLLYKQISDFNCGDVLNGPFVTVGKFTDALNKNTDSDGIRITLLNGNQGCQSFVNNNYRGSLTNFGDEAWLAFPTTMLRILPGRIAVFPKDTLDDKSNLAAAESFAERIALEIFNGTYSDIAAMQHWIARVTGGVEIEHNLDSVYYSINGCSIAQNDLSFGIRNAVSIILACLYVPNGSVIFIENPEAGLYPRAQAELSKFLYFIANSGKQIFVETHSDHILNALRVGVTSKEMTPARIAINYLVKDKEKGNCQCNPVRIEENGDLHGENNSMSLDGFFDQYSKDLDEMLGL
jgi:predicted ATPase